MSALISHPVERRWTPVSQLDWEENTCWDNMHEYFSCIAVTIRCDRWVRLEKSNVLNVSMSVRRSKSIRARRHATVHSERDRRDYRCRFTWMIIESCILEMLSSNRFHWTHLTSVHKSIDSMADSRSSAMTSFFTYYPLFLTCMTTVLNSFILLVFYQKVFRQRPTIRYMRAMAIVDALMLYGWNLDHFFNLKYGFEVDRLNVLSCKLATYFNHVLIQTSAWLRVWMCVDRFLILNQVSQRRAVYQDRRVIFLIVLTFLAIALINLHLPIFSCYSYNNGTKVSAGSLHYRLYPTWNYISFVIYNVLPFLIMSVFSALIIRHLILLKRSTTLSRSRVRHVSISIVILLSTGLFCVMTTPPAIMLSFFRFASSSQTSPNIILTVLDSIKYTYHSSTFFLYVFTLVEFRVQLWRVMRCSCLAKHLLTRNRSHRYAKESFPMATIINAWKMLINVVSHHKVFQWFNIYM